MSVIPFLEQVYQHAVDWSQYALPKSRAYHEVYLDEELVAGGEPEVEPMYGATYLPPQSFFFKTGFALPPSNDVDIFSSGPWIYCHRGRRQAGGLQCDRRR